MNFQEYTSCFEDLEHTPTKLKAIRYTIDKALEQNDWNNALKLYYEFVNEDAQYQDCYQAILLFPEYIAFFEKHPECWERHQFYMRNAYTRIIHHITAFYQVPLQQIIEIYHQYKDFCIRFNYGELDYYDELFWFFWDFGFVPQFGMASIEECYQTAKKHMNKNRINRNRACELDFDVLYLLYFKGDIKAALQKAAPILEGKLYDSHIPHTTYASFSEVYFEHGDWEQALVYSDKAYHLNERDFSDLGSMYYTSERIMHLAYIDLPQALKLFRRKLPIYSTSKDGIDNFRFYNASYRLMAELEKSEQQEIHLKFPYVSEPIYNDKGVYDVAELKDFFYQRAKIIADRFDERDGNKHFHTQLTKEYRQR